jgi:hypothetical protein
MSTINREADSMRSALARLARTGLRAGQASHARPGFAPVACELTSPSTEKSLAPRRLSGEDLRRQR